jgi:hypothetical protein
VSAPGPDCRVSFDFEIDFSNGGGIQGQGFRLDLEDEDIGERELADYIVKDLRLLMVKEVRILNKRIIFEQHKRAATPAASPANAVRLIDLSHADTRLHCDPARLQLAQLAEVAGVVIRLTGAESRAVGWQALAASDVHGKAVLIQADPGSYLTPAAATYLRDQGAVLVGIDSAAALPGAGIPVVEQLRGLDQLPIDGFTFSAVPPVAQGAGTFVVRAYARLQP